MGERKHPSSKAREKFAGWIKLQDRRLRAANTGGGAGWFGIETSMKNPDVSVCIGIDGNYSSPHDARGELRPTFGNPVRIRLGLRSECKENDRRDDLYDARGYDITASFGFLDGRDHITAFFVAP